MKEPCIYQIRNTVTGRVYIGSSNNGWRRRQEHLRKLRLGIHDNRHLQASFTKHGEAAFEFTIVELVEESDLVHREQATVDALRGAGMPLYNIGDFVDVPLRGVKGEKHPHFGRKLSPEHRVKSGQPGERNPMFGRKHSEESKRKMSIHSTGKKMSDEARAKMSQAGKGKAKSEEHKAKIRAANIGRTKPRGSSSHSFKGVIEKYDGDTKVAEYSGSAEILNAGYSPPGVYSCLSGKQATHRGFTWKRKA